jgi:hypothetical protein
MPDSLSLTLQAAIRWANVSSLDLSNVQDTSTLEYSEGIVNGTAVDQADKLWHDKRTITAGANDDLDLTALVNTIFGSTVTTSFAKVKGILIINTSTTTGDVLRIDTSVTHGFTKITGSATGKIEVGPDSAQLLANKKDGWAVTDSSNDVLRINNPGANPIDYEIVIFGTSA